MGDNGYIRKGPQILLRYCACGNKAVKRSFGTTWVCERCLRIEEGLKHENIIKSTNRQIYANQQIARQEIRS